MSVLSGTFLALPFSLLVFAHFTIIDALIVCIFGAALLADAFTTSLGLKHGLREFSPLFSLLRGKVSDNRLIIYSTLMGVALGSIVVAVLPTPVLLFLTVISMIGVVGNSYALSARLVVAPRELHQTDEG